MISPKLRRQLTGIALTTCALAVVLSVGFVVTSLHPSRSASMTVIAVEPRSPAATTEADLAAELSQVHGGGLLLTEIADQTAAPALEVNLDCPSGSDPITCDQLQAKEMLKASTVADQLATGTRSPTPDLYATFSDISAYLHEGQRDPHGAVNLFINTIGDAVTPQDLVQADLSNPTVVSSLVHGAVSEGAFPGRGACRGWRVHVVIPATSDPAHDLGMRTLFSQLINECGGSLVDWVPRWIVASNRTLAMPIINGVESPRGSASEPMYRLSDTLFAVGSSEITTVGAAALNEVAASILNHYPGRPFTCQGRADGAGGTSTGALAFDLSLSSSRAKSVCDYLVQEGLPADLAHVVALGQTTTKVDATQRSVGILIGNDKASD